MSNLALPNKDDYPSAAAKHLGDAEALVSAKRYDGASYLIGYVVECSLRTVIMIGEIARLGAIPPAQLRTHLDATSSTLRRFKTVSAREARARGRGHDLADLAEATTNYKNELNSANAMYAPPVDKKKPPFGGGWTESIRYRAEGDVTEATAQAWVREAEAVYKSTIGMMIRDGLIKK